MTESLPGYPKFYQAIKRGDCDEVRRIAKQSPEFPGNGNSLHAAVAEGKTEMIRLLVELGADLEFDNIIFGTPVTEAARTGQLGSLNTLRELGASLEPTGRVESDFFISAILDDQIESIRWLLEAGCDPNRCFETASGRLRSPLSVAKDKNKQEMVELLEQHGAKLPEESRASEIEAEVIVAAMSGRFKRSVEPNSLTPILPDGIGEQNIRVNSIQPTDAHPFWVLFTSGMSDQPLDVPKSEEENRFVELVMYLPGPWPNLENAPEDWDWPAVWLRNLAIGPHTEGTWYSGNGTIVSSADPPLPLGNTQFSSFLVQPVNLDSVERDGELVKFFGVIPLFTEERDFAVTNGIGKLWDRLEAIGISTLVDIDRENSCKK